MLSSDEKMHGEYHSKRVAKPPVLTKQARLNNDVLCRGTIEFVPSCNQEQQICTRLSTASSGSIEPLMCHCRRYPKFSVILDEVKKISITDGTVVKGSGPKIYVLKASQREWMTDPETLQQHEWCNIVISLSDENLSAIS